MISIVGSAQRTPGYYWVEWSESADKDLVARRPGPLVGEWDGRVWWFSRIEAYQFDCDVAVIEPFTQNLPGEQQRSKDPRLYARRPL